MKTISCISFGLLVLAGCGDETTETLFTPNVSTSVIAYDKLATATVNVPQSIDLSSSINGQELRLTGIYSDTPKRCFAQTDEGLKVNVELSELGRCNFIYKVQNAQNLEASAKLIVLTSSNFDTLLPTITENFSVSDEVSINLIDYLGTNALSGFAIDMNGITVQSELGSEQITPQDLTVQDFVFKFQAPESIGWHNISYVLNNQSTQESKMGEIFISINDESYPAPAIKVTYKNGNETSQFSGFIYTGDSVISKDASELEVNLNELCNTVNLTLLDQKCLKVTSAEDWQLTYAKATEADTLPFMDDTNNKSMKVSTATNGHHDISYVVSNHYGASSMGVMRIYAADKKIDFDKDWESLDFYTCEGDCDDRITKHNQRDEDLLRIHYHFQAPLTHVEAVNGYTNFNYHQENREQNTYLVSTWTSHEAAKQCPPPSFDDICPRLTRDDYDYYKCRAGLPKEDDFIRLQEEAGKNNQLKAELDKWPKGGYFTNDGRIYNLAARTFSTPKEGELAYVSCVKAREKWHHDD